MDIGQAMKNWKANSGIWGGFNHDQPSSPGMDVANQLEGMGGMGSTPQARWGGAQPGHVQMGGQTIGIPRQPWGFGAMPELEAIRPRLQAALASDETGQEINWAALSQLYGQLNQQAQPRGIAPQPVAGRGRQIDPDQVGQEQQAMANAAVQPRLLVNGNPLAPRRRV